MKALTKWLIGAVLVLALPMIVAAQQQPSQPSRNILLSVHAENEGPNGLWVQAGRDLSVKELATFQQLLDKSFTTMKDIRLVEVQDKRDHFEVIVSVTKVRRDSVRWWYAVSSVIGMAEPKIDEFVSHNVIVGEDLKTVANAVGFSFASIRLRMALGSPN